MEGSTKNTEIRIYVACLAAYNNGVLHGAWIDAEQDANSIYDEAKDMLNASPIAGAEEWAIHDYEGFEGVQISEWEGFEEVSKMAAFISAPVPRRPSNKERHSRCQPCFRPT